MKDDLEDLEALEEPELRHRLERGDYFDPEKLHLVEKMLKKFEKERKFIEKCEKASIEAALNAKKSARNSNIIAYLALIVSILSLYLHK